jgi:hypothetical protein
VSHRKNKSVDLNDETRSSSSKPILKKRDPNFSYEKHGEDPLPKGKGGIKVVNAVLYESNDNTLKYR